MGRNRPSGPALVPENWAEWLLDLGARVARQIQGGAGIEEAASRLEAPTNTCKLALVFLRSGDLVKLRALVEDWSCERILSELGAIRRSAPTPPECPRPIGKP